MQIPSTSPLQDVHLNDYLRVIMRRRRTFLLAFCAVFIGVFYHTFTMKPIYEASATLHVRNEQGKGSLLGELGLGQQNSIDADIEILKSRTNAEQVVKKLHLDWQVQKKSKGLSFHLLEFDGVAPGGSCQVELTGADSYKLLDSAGNTLCSGKGGVIAQAGSLRLLITDIKGKPGDSFQLSKLSLLGAANGLKGRIKASEIGNKTGIVRLAYSDTDPQLTRDVVNTLAQVYLEQSVTFKTQEASKSLDFIEEQMKSVRGELDSAEKNLEAYKMSSGIISLDTESQKVFSKLSEVDKDLTQMGLQKKQMEFNMASLKDAMKKGKSYYPSDPVVSAMVGKLVELEGQKRGLISEFTEAHPQVRAVQGQIDEVQKRIIALYESNLKNLTKQESSVRQILNGYEGALKKLPETERELARRMRHTKVNADIYTLLLQKHEEARIARASTISNINIIDPAITPGAPIKPNKQKNLLLGLLVGLMLGVGLAFFQEYLDDSIKDAEGARLQLNAPVLAVIPFIPRREGDENGRSASLITQLEPKSAVSEAFRSLRTSIHFSAINREKKFLLITSTFPGEGKTTISANLAVTLSQTGGRVLLLDCDLRRPQLHNLFSRAKVPGLTEVLAGDATLESVLYDTGISGLDFVSAGTSPPNPAELLGSEQMANLLLSLGETYDHILIDAPPVLAVTDAPLLTTRCDMAMVVLETERVPVKAAQRMHEMLANVQAPVAGVIVNDKFGRSRERYGYYGGYYGYGYYGSGYYGEDEKAAKGKKPLWRRWFKW